MEIQNIQNFKMIEKVDGELTEESAKTFIAYINELFVPIVEIHAQQRQLAIEEEHNKNGFFSLVIMVNGKTSYKHNVTPPLFTLIRDETYKVFEILQRTVFKLTFDASKAGLISDDVRYQAVNILFDFIADGIYLKALESIFAENDRMTNEQLNDILADVAATFLNEVLNPETMSIQFLVNVCDFSTSKHAKNVIYRLTEILKNEDK